MEDAEDKEIEGVLLQPSSPLCMSKLFTRCTKAQKGLLAKFPEFLDGVTGDDAPPTHELLFLYMSMHREGIFALVKAQFVDVATCDIQASKLTPQFLKAIYKKYAVVLGMSYNQAHTRPHPHTHSTHHTHNHTLQALTSITQIASREHMAASNREQPEEGANSSSGGAKSGVLCPLAYDI
jgi:hypothetical protein